MNHPALTIETIVARQQATGLSALSVIHRAKKEREARFKAAAMSRDSVAVQRASEPELTPAQLIAAAKRRRAAFKASWQQMILMASAEQCFQASAVGRIMKEISVKYGVTINDLKSVRRTGGRPVARFELYWRLYRETRFSMPQIGDHCGGKDHTSILYGIRKYEHLQAVKAGKTVATAADLRVNMGLIISEESRIG